MFLGFSAAVGLQTFIFYSLVRFGLFAILGGGLCDQTLPGEFGHKGGSPDRRLAPALSIF